MEDLDGIRKNFKTKKLSKRFHSLPFSKLQTIIEYKASLEGIEVKYLTKKDVKNTSKECHTCGHVALVRGRIYEFQNCGMEYDRDLSACINIAHRVMSSMGWRSCEPQNQHMRLSAKPQPKAGTSRLVSQQNGPDGDR